MACCGPRSRGSAGIKTGQDGDGEAEALQREDSGHSRPPPSPAAAGTAPASAASAKLRRSTTGSALGGVGASTAGLRLRVRIVRAQGLLGMDIAGMNMQSMSLQRTLDAYVTVGVNEEKEEFEKTAGRFGKTEVKWKSKGDPEWNENFETFVKHRQSYLCIKVWDDDQLLGQDATSLAQRQCGFLEVPLWLLPRNSTVAGWFTLHHPELADEASSLADRQAKVEQQQHTDSGGEGAASDDAHSAGQVKLELFLEGTAMQEILSGMGPPPVFQASPPPLNLPQFIEDITEAKRIFLERLLLAAINAVKFSLSWENKALSFTVLCWYWFLFYWPCFIWSTVWVLVLLCFWHEMPKESKQQREATKKAQEADPNKQGLIGGTVSGLGAVVGGVGGAAYSVLSKPVEGVRQGGVKGLVVGVKDGVVQGVGKATTGVVSGVSGIAGGFVGTISSVRAPGLMEFQQILTLKPALKTTLRGVQPTLRSVHLSLQAADDFFYWGDFETTKKAVKAVLGALVLSIVLCSYMAIASWYCFFVLGSVVIMANASFFQVFVAFAKAVVAVLTRPRAPFVGCNWFQLDAEAGQDGPHR